MFKRAKRNPELDQLLQPESLGQTTTALTPSERDQSQLRLSVSKEWFESETPKCKLMEPGFEYAAAKVLVFAADDGCHLAPSIQIPEPPKLAPEHSGLEPARPVHSMKRSQIGDGDPQLATQISQLRKDLVQVRRELARAQDALVKKEEETRCQLDCQRKALEEEHARRQREAEADNLMIQSVEKDQHREEVA